MTGIPYNGFASNVAPPAAVNIASSTNTDPIVLLTTTAHGMLSGDWVDIEGHQTNTNANGVSPVTYVSPTQFSVPLSGNGVGGATGTAQPISFTGNVSLLCANGDPNAAPTWIPGMANSSDRTAFLVKNLGAYKLAALLTFQVSNDAGATWASNGDTEGVGTWTPLVSVSAGYPPTLPAGGGDVLRVSWAGTVIPDIASGLTRQKLGIMVANAVPGVVPAPAAYIKLVGASVDLIPAGDTNTPFSLNGITEAFVAGNFYFQLGVFQLGSPLGGVTCIGDTTCIIEQWRPTGWPQ